MDKKLLVIGGIAIAAIFALRSRISQAGVPLTGVGGLLPFVKALPGTVTSHSVGVGAGSLQNKSSVSVVVHVSRQYSKNGGSFIEFSGADYTLAPNAAVFVPGDSAIRNLGGNESLQGRVVVTITSPSVPVPVIFQRDSNVLTEPVDQISVVYTPGDPFTNWR